MNRKQTVPDPIHGSIELPDWLVRIGTQKPVRRMMFIRQLGLKAYLDFPGAIHTRYSHALGAMHLAGKIAISLKEKMKAQGYPHIAQAFEDNRNNLMAAGFLHDIGHGPFSHAVDFALKRITGKTHEEIAKFVLESYLRELENFGISVESVVRIINNQHTFPFMSAIVNGQLDVDKLDYLLRDSHHVGLRYSFDLDYFVSSYKVLGMDEQLERCELGLESNTVAVVTAEIFLLIWKSMYDLVYHVPDSRTGEKMLEKAILVAADEEGFKSAFVDMEKFIDLNDDGLLELLRRGGEFPKEIVNNIVRGTVFPTVLDSKLLASDFAMDAKFTDDLAHISDSELSEELTLQLCSDLGLAKYSIICDIMKSRVPLPVNLDELDENNEPIELKDVSSIVKAIDENIRIKIYSKSKDIPQLKELKNKLVAVLQGW